MLGLRERGGRRVTPVPGCTLLPPEALRMAAAAQNLAQDLARRNGLNAWNAPEQRHQPARRRQSRTFQNRMLLGRDAEQAGGFWRFLTLRRGLAADLRSPRWWALCLTSPGDATARPQYAAWAGSCWPLSPTWRPLCMKNAAERTP